MPTLPSRYWQELTTEDFAALDPETTVAVMPVAAIEQHGPHLPVYVDACLNKGVMDRAIDLMPDDLGALVLPMLAVGKSDEHINFPGTLTLSNETLQKMWFEVGASVARVGVRKLVIYNSHGGQRQHTEIIARELRLAHEMFVVAVNPSSFGRPEGLFPPGELRHGIHAGSVETSMMLHLRPDLVHMNRAADFRPDTYDVEENYEILRAIGPVSFGWKAQDMQVDGVCGNALDADAERGEKVVDFMAGKLVTLIGEVADYPLSNVRGPDWRD